MDRLQGILRALMLALALPALLVPSGWSAHICLCKAMETLVGVEGCCAEAEVETPSCCEAAADEAQERAAPAGCDHGGGIECCREVETGELELLAKSCECVSAPPLALAPVHAIPALAREPARARADCVSRAMAPPRVGARLPLRI